MICSMEVVETVFAPIEFSKVLVVCEDRGFSLRMLGGKTSIGTSFGWISNIVVIGCVCVADRRVLSSGGDASRLNGASISPVILEL